MKQLMTRVYFADEPTNEDDFVLRLVDPARRPTLMARRLSESTPIYIWGVVLQGEDETVFFDL